jgi:hypothetical protein
MMGTSAASPPRWINLNAGVLRLRAQGAMLRELHHIGEAPLDP